MAVVDFPRSLRTAIQDSKSRSVDPSFRQSHPAVGPPYTESFSDDRNTVWTFQLRFQGTEDDLFWAWFQSSEYCDAGRNAFRIGMKVGSFNGAVQELRFTPEGVPQLVSQAGNVYTYQCTAIGRGIQNIPAPEVIITWPEIYGDDIQAHALDRAINLRWPT